MKRFVFDIAVDEENICNLVEDKKKLIAHARAGHRVVFIGQRNTGKTTLLVNIVMPRFRKDNPKGLTIYCDLMGVQSLQDLGKRFFSAYEESVAQLSPTSTFIRSFVKILKGARPKLTFDESGSPQFSLGLELSESEMPIATLLQFIGKQHKNHPTLILFDEFQDIAFVPQAEAILRNALQFLPSDLPVIVTGSKKHLLGKIFADPRAPLAGWGQEMEISEISTADYLDYINERFEPAGLIIQSEQVLKIQQLSHNIPEAINLLCHHILCTHNPKYPLNEKNIFKAFQSMIESRRGRFEELLVRFSEDEQILLSALANHEPIKNPQGKQFLSQVPQLSASGVHKIISRFENEALVYKTARGYQISDPIFAGFLKRFRKP